MIDIRILVIFAGRGTRGASRAGNVLCLDLGGCSMWDCIYKSVLSCALKIGAIYCIYLRLIIIIIIIIIKDCPSFCIVARTDSRETSWEAMTKTERKAGREDQPGAATG